MKRKLSHNEGMQLSKKTHIDCRGILFALSAFWLSACATTDRSIVQSQKTAQNSAHAKSALSARDLDPGECGLFIWFESGSQFAVFSQNGKGASLATPNGEVSLVPTEPLASVTSKPSQDAYNQYPVQDFVDESGKTYSLKLSQAENNVNGIRYKGGIWRTTSSDGWDIVKSAIGYSTCIPQYSPVEAS